MIVKPVETPHRLLQALALESRHPHPEFLAIYPKRI